MQAAPPCEKSHFRPPCFSPKKAQRMGAMVRSSVLLVAAVHVAAAAAAAEWDADLHLHPQSTVEKFDVRTTPGRTGSMHRTGHRSTHAILPPLLRATPSVHPACRAPWTEAAAAAAAAAAACRPSASTVRPEATTTARPRLPPARPSGSSISWAACVKLPSL